MRTELHRIAFTVAEARQILKAMTFLGLEVEIFCQGNWDDNRGDTLHGTYSTPCTLAPRGDAVIHDGERFTRTASANVLLVGKDVK